MNTTKRLPEKLLAKSRRNGRDVTLEQHSLDTETAAERLFRLDGRWGQNWCRFFKIAEAERARFLLNLRVACLFHDLGKANVEFHRMVSGERGAEQILRHEHLSALLLHLPEVRAWLARNAELDVEVITAAVLSHHLKANNDGDWAWCRARRSGALTLFLEHEEVTRVLARVAAVAGLPQAPALPETAWRDASPWAEAFANGRTTASRFRRAVSGDDDSTRRSLLLAVKAGLMAADSASSGLVRVGRELAWIDAVANQPDITSSEIHTKIIDPRVRQIEARLGRAFSYQTFQERAATQGARVLLLAACGAGKTLAAWKWIAETANQRRVGKVVFLYPTRGTATEGFRDYVGWAPEADAALMHGTAEYELRGMAANPSDATDGKQFGLSETEARLFALGYWHKRFFSATVDQFLSFMEHRYESLCLLPALADSIVVVDEVHSFDRRMFENLVSFLKAFDVPTLCMTATLPPTRRSALEATGLKVFPTPKDRTDLGDLEYQETRPRYQLEPVGSEDEAYLRAVTAYRAGRRVLWVVNQVARCQRLAQRLEAELATQVLCYHSRFKLFDRQRVHGKTVESFKQSTKPAIAVTTQVCEMSLDLDADVLITEVAPVTALVQRFGRSNRSAAREAEFRSVLHTYEPADPRPYGRDEIDAARRFLADVGGGEISQRGLAEALERHAPGETKPDESAAFLRGGYYAIPASFRDSDDQSTACVLDRDLPRIEADRVRGLPLDGWFVSVRKPVARPGLARPSWLSDHQGIVSAAQYSEDFGFLANVGGDS